MATRSATRADGSPPSRTSRSSTPRCSARRSSSARWEPVDALPPLGFDHPRIVVDAVERLRGKLWWSNIAVGLLPERFTMPQARRVFEAISGVTYEPSNFRRELEQSGLVRATGTLAKGGPDVPPRCTNSSSASRPGAFAVRAHRRCCGAEADRAPRQPPAIRSSHRSRYRADWAPTPSAHCEET